jgi:hypothetical protein
VRPFSLCVTTRRASVLLPVRPLTVPAGGWL